MPELQNNYDIQSDPRFKMKVARIATGKETLVSACKECPYYQSVELKDWEFCHKAAKPLKLSIGQNFPIWCELEIAS